MSTSEIVILSLVVGAFVVFAATLFWVSLGSGSAITLDEGRERQTREDNSGPHSGGTVPVDD